MAGKTAKAAKAAVFLIGAVFLVHAASGILEIPAGTYWAEKTGMEEVHAHPKQYDVLTVGTSTGIANICNQELYSQYGIAGVSLAEPEQPLYLSYYTLMDAFEFQTPSVVFLDTRALFYGDQTDETNAKERADYVIHKSADPIVVPSVKYQLVGKLKALNPDIDKYEYYFQLHYSHNNWKVLSEENFTGYSPYDCMNGNIATYGMSGDVGDIYGNSPEEEEVQIDEGCRDTFEQLLGLCDQNAVQLVLMTSYVSSTKGQHKAAAELAEKYGIDYLDINEVSDQIGLNNSLHVSDDNTAYAHLNLEGSILWADYLGEYLSENYEIPDRRQDKKYERFNRQEEVFRKQKECIETKTRLCSCLCYNDYFDVLKDINLENHDIFISVYADSSTCFTAATYQRFRSIGLQTDLGEKNSLSYAAHISGDGVEEKASQKEVVSIEGRLEKVSFQINSSKNPSLGLSDIFIDANNYIMRGQGINVVVYNKTLRQVVSSVFFNTNSYENPPTQRMRIVDQPYAEQQIEIAPNEWERDS